MSNKYKSNNLIKKLLYKLKEHFTDDIKNDIRDEIMFPLYIEIQRCILPHYIVFITFFIIIIILVLILIYMVMRNK